MQVFWCMRSFCPKIEKFFFSGSVNGTLKNPSFLILIFAYVNGPFGVILGYFGIT